MKTPRRPSMTPHFWVFIGIVLTVVTGTSCFTNLGLFGLGCGTSVSISLVWIFLSVAVAVVAATNLVSGRPGEGK